MYVRTCTVRLHVPYSTMWVSPIGVRALLAGWCMASCCSDSHQQFNCRKSKGAMDMSRVAFITVVLMWMHSGSAALQAADNHHLQHAKLIHSTAKRAAHIRRQRYRSERQLHSPPKLLASDFMQPSQIHADLSPNDGIFSPIAFGADPTGLADSTDAFNRCLSSFFSNSSKSGGHEMAVGNEF